MGEKDKKAGPTKRKPKKHSESVSSEQLESHTLHEDEEMQPPSETLPTKNVLDENKDETEHRILQSTILNCAPPSMVPMYVRKSYSMRR